MASKKKARLNEELAQDITSKFTHSMTWRNPFKEKWDRFYKMYRSYLSDTSYPWQSNLWIPYSFSTVETVAPRMVSNKPQIDIMPRQPGDEEYAEIMGELIDFQWERMGMEEILSDTVKSSLLYGTSIWKVFWDRSEREVEKDVPADEEFPELGTVKEEVTEVMADNPSVELVDLYDFFWDPRAIDIKSARWVIHRMYRTYEHLEMMQKQGVYKNIKLLKDMTIPTDDDDKADRRSTLGVAMPDELDKEGKQYIELLEYWEDDRIVVVANREVIIRDEENPYKHGKKPFIRIVDQSVPHEFLGVGELEPIETLQYELNQRRNQRMDNITLALNRMWKVRNGAGVDEDELVSDAGGVVHVDEMAGLEPLLMPDVTGSSYQEETLIKGDIQQTTGVSDFTRGVGSDALANDTATGISLIQEAGNARFRLKVRNMETGIKDLGEMMVSLNNQFVDETKVVRLLDDRGVRWLEVQPEDLKDEFDVIVQAGSTLPNNEAVQRKQTMEAFQMFAGDPDVDQLELKKMVAKVVLPEANLEKLFAAPQPAQVVPPPGLPAPGGVPTQEGLLQSVQPEQPSI